MNENLDTDLIYTWPLVVLIRDDFVPEAAPHVISAFQGLDDQSCALTFALYTMDARMERN